MAYEKAERGIEKPQARAFEFLELNRAQQKPRKLGLTEIRGPYYTPIGKRYLADLFETMSAWIDSLKFAGGSFALMPALVLGDLIRLCHEHQVLVSTGGFIEHVLTRGASSVDRYIEECKQFEFDIIEISSGFLSLPPDDLLRLTEKVQRAGLKAKVEVGVQFGAGGATEAEELEREGIRDPSWAILQATRHLEAGAYMIMLESEGITENVRSWRTELISAFVRELGLEKMMFEAADPSVFSWYIKTYGPDVNLFVDHSQIVQLQALRSGIWGTQSLWGRVRTYKQD